ncbi:hypothetical protein DFH09DRAFT_1446981 [Mycena vulgaris]|nr:hypothetical protein DFH09DRAFT_1446981 [Mycena vulgaris]
MITTSGNPPRAGACEWARAAPLDTLVFGAAEPDEVRNAEVDGRGGVGAAQEGEARGRWGGDTYEVRAEATTPAPASSANPLSPSAGACTSAAPLGAVLGDVVGADADELGLADELDFAVSRMRSPRKIFGSLNGVYYWTHPGSRNRLVRPTIHQVNSEGGCSPEFEAESIKSRRRLHQTKKNGLANYFLSSALRVRPNSFDETLLKYLWECGVQPRFCDFAFSTRPDRIWRPKSALIHLLDEIKNFKLKPTCPQVFEDQNLSDRPPPHSKERKEGRRAEKVNGNFGNAARGGGGDGEAVCHYIYPHESAGDGNSAELVGVPIALLLPAALADVEVVELAARAPKARESSRRGLARLADASGRSEELKKESGKRRAGDDISRAMPNRSTVGACRGRRWRLWAAFLARFLPNQY